MIHHAAIPGELVMSGWEEGDTGSYQCLPWAGGFLTVQPTPEGAWVIVRLEHTNPFAYLHPVINPGWLYVLPRRTATKD